MASRVTATGTVSAWQELVLGARISGLALVGAVLVAPTAHAAAEEKEVAD